MTRPYNKPALSFEQQADKLIARGMQVADRTLLIERLSQVNYYRLSAYWYPFRDQHNNNLLPGTSFETVWNRYVFDRQLRLLVMDAIERIEVSIKTKMVNAFTMKNGAFGHLDRNCFKKDIDSSQYDKFIATLRDSAGKSPEQFVKHSRNTYDRFPDLPLWKACELMSLGNTFTMYRLVERKLQLKIAGDYSLKAKTLQSWLHSISYVRNLCAHHGRLWNKELSIKPIIPDKRNAIAFHMPDIIPNSRVFAILTIEKYMLDLIAPQSKWKQRLIHLLNRYPEIPLREMGFPEGWEQYPIWL